ncbi:prenyltransferase [Neptuniibacter marinus]|uniref:prenyltransferase n=1 Tax=Neptuniibacter marinus TaxID=1806670 RepID=UPI00082E7541|nr:prenyltransferase [Neptuniibacter marinus]
MMLVERYRFSRALRPFSFSVAFIVCLTGIVAAYREGFSDPLNAFLILLAGLLLQAGVNLINDFSDLTFLSGPQYQTVHRQIKINFRIGLCCFLIASCIGVYFIYLSGPFLLVLSVVGLFGALGYTLEPINYKHRGLAVFFVFWLMGVMMVLGAYFIQTKVVKVDVFFLSIPVSLFTSLLLLSNEIRDYEDDRDKGIRTLSVRVGYDNAILIYKMMIAAIYLVTILLGLADILPWSYWLLLTLPIVILPCRFLHRERDARRQLTPETGRGYFVFGLFYCCLLAL